MNTLYYVSSCLHLQRLFHFLNKLASFNDYCSDLMYFQSYLGLGLSVMCIQRHIVGNVFLLTFFIHDAFLTFFRRFKNSFWTILHQLLLYCTTSKHTSEHGPFLLLEHVWHVYISYTVTGCRSTRSLLRFLCWIHWSHLYIDDKIQITITTAYLLSELNILLAALIIIVPM